MLVTYSLCRLQDEVGRSSHVKGRNIGPMELPEWAHLLHWQHELEDNFAASFADLRFQKFVT